MKRLIVIFIALFCVGGVSFSQKKPANKVQTIVIDPGHGGAKPGAVGRQTREKDIVLSIALKFGKRIEETYPDMKVIYTRKSDVDIDLSERAHIANRAKADLFISIHANSYPGSGPTGVETFVMGLSQSKANMEVAKKENADILLEADYKSNSEYQGFDPNSPESYVMFAMFQNAYMDRSLNFAQFIQNQYMENLHTLDRGVKQAELFVLYKTTMPSVLTEVGFISNPDEEQFMASEEGQAKIVSSLFNAFVAYKCQEEGTKLEIKAKAESTATPKTELTAVEKTETIPPVLEPIDLPEPQMADKSSVVKAEPQSNPMPTPRMVAAELLAEERMVDVMDPKTIVPEPVVEKKAVEKKTPADPYRNRVVYKVQFMSSNRLLKKGAPEFKGITQFEYYVQNKNYRYTTGRETDLNEALRLQKRVREIGFADAFMVAFYNGERISTEEAKRLSRKK